MSKKTTKKVLKIESATHVDLNLIKASYGRRAQATMDAHAQNVRTPHGLATNLSGTRYHKYRYN